MAETPQVEEPPVVVTTTRQKPESNRQKPKRLPPYAVVVHNDDAHTFHYVIETFQKVFGYDEQKGFLLAYEIHTRGRAIVWSGAKEVAELKRDQIRGAGPDHWASKPVTFPLSVSIEPLPQ